MHLIALVGSISTEVSSAVLRCESPRKAIEAHARLVVMRETEWLGCRDEAPDGAIYALISSSSREAYGAYLHDSRVRHVLSEGEALSSELEETLAIASGQAPFSVSSLRLGECGFTSRLRSSGEEPALRETALQFARGAGARGRAAQNWLDALSEAVTNAVYNAPRSGTVAPYLGLHRKHAVELADSHGVEVRAFATERALAFSVTDAFGSLTPQQFQEAMGRTLSKGDARAAESPGGAGLGLMMMFDRLDRLVAMVTPGTQTSVIGVGPLTYSGPRRGRTVQFFEPLERRDPPQPMGGPAPIA